MLKAINRCEASNKHSLCSADFWDLPPSCSSLLVTFSCLSLKPGFYSQHNHGARLVEGWVLLTAYTPSWLGMQWNSRDPSHCRLMYSTSPFDTDCPHPVSCQELDLTSLEQTTPLLCFYCSKCYCNTSLHRKTENSLISFKPPLQPSGTGSLGCWLQQAAGSSRCSLELLLCCSTAAAAAWGH